MNSLRPRVRDVCRRVDDADHPAPSGHGILQFVEDLRRHQHWLSEEVHQEQECQELTQTDRPARGEDGADHQHQGQRQAGKRLA